MKDEDLHGLLYFMTIPMHAVLDAAQTHPTFVKAFSHHQLQTAQALLQRNALATELDRTLIDSSYYITDEKSMHSIYQAITGMT